jgi:hypothetical protein
MENQNTQFTLTKNGYAAFDALSLRQLIIDRLNEQGTFTDQNYLGSNLATIIDIISYAFHTLIFYLNRTSSESTFTEAQLYENINRIVKLVDYSPIGAQTSTVTFSCSATNLSQGTYTIPRYTYFATSRVPFSFNEDVTFVKTTNNTIEFLSEISSQKLLYQGIYQEYPLYTAAGDENEVVILNPGTGIIDHFNIDVYVKRALTGKWEAFSRTVNLFLESSTARKFEIRLNSNDRYEIKFGNNINGYKLEAGDQVAIYYLNSAGAQGEIGIGAFTQVIGSPVIYNTPQYNAIIADVLSDQYQLIQSTQSQFIRIINSNNSTKFTPKETVDDIRMKAPVNYQSQYRLVTSRDYETFIESNFNNFISNIRVFSNFQYISEYMRYFYDIGLTSPELTERALFNQINFSDACNFNNVYLIAVPRAATEGYDYLLPAQKSFIITSLQDKKTLTTDITFADPIYMTATIGIINTNKASTFIPEVEEKDCYLEIVKRPTTRRDNDSIINDAVNVFKKYFSRENATLGQIVAPQTLTQQLLAIDGVERVFTKRQDDSSLSYEGVSLFLWNPLYTNNDKNFIVNNYPLRTFQYPLLFNSSIIATKFRVVASTTSSRALDY